MGKKIEDIVTKYASTGDCEIDVDLMVKLWNHTWGIYQYGEQYRLIKQLRLNTGSTGSTSFKVQIPIAQAKELIERLKLDGEKDAMFIKATTWRQSEIFWAKHKAMMAKKNKV